MTSYLIDKLKNNRRWVFSNDFINMPVLSEDDLKTLKDHRKRPMFMGDYVNARRTNLPDQSIHLVRDYVDNDERNLNSYQDLELPELSNFKRAYRLQASQDLIIALDIEPDTSPELLNFFSKIPAHFSEWSTNNGLHLFYQLDPSKLSPEIRQLLTLSVKKIKDPGQTPSQKITYELMMNDHWLTFTNKINQAQIVPITDPVPDVIYQMIQTIAKTEYQRQLEMIEIAIDAQTLSQNSEALSKWLEFSEQITEISQITPEQFENDLSRFEYNIALRLAGYVEYRCENAEPFVGMIYKGLNPHKTSISDRVKTVYILLQQILPQRPKHQEFRNKMPWLLHQAVKAYEYILSANKQKIEREN